MYMLGAPATRLKVAGGGRRAPRLWPAHGEEI